MGNENSSPTTFETNSNKANSKQKQPRSSSQLSKLYDEFFITHHKLYSLSHTIDVSLINPKRIVFISITGLFRSWKRCPSILLYNAIIIIPLKKDWILQPDAYHHDYNHMLEDEEFVTLLRWKSYQNLAIFLADTDDENDMQDIDSSSDPTKTSSNKNSRESTATTTTTTTTRATTNIYDYNDDSDIIAPVWRRLNTLLQELHDPISKTNSKYNGLIFNEKYWKHKSSVCKNKHNSRLFANMNNLHMAQYCINVDDILLELYTVTMRFQTIKIILLESNPTLNIITNYYIKSNTNDTENNTQNIILYPPPNVSKNIVEKNKNVSKIVKIKNANMNNISEYNSEIECECKYNMSEQESQNRNKSHDEIIVQLDSNWWIADDYFDNNTLYDDIIAVNKFEDYKKKNESVKKIEV